MNLFLSPTERHALRRAVDLLGLDRRRFALSVLAGVLGMGSAIGLSATAAWLIARASQLPDVVALGVAPVAVRLFGVSRSALRYGERLVSHDTALRGMSTLRARLYTILATSRTDTVASLRRGDVLARVGADVDAVGDLVVRAYLPMAVATTLGVLTTLGICLVHLPAGLILGACLLLSGVVGPLITIRSARAAERARQEQATDLSALVLSGLEHGAELAVASRMPSVLSDLGRLENHLARSRDRAALPAAVAEAVNVLAVGLAVLGALLLGIPAVTEGTLRPVMLAVIVLVPLASFEASAALGPASVQLVTSAGAAVRIIELVERAEASSSQVPQPLALPPRTAAGPVLLARDLAVGWPGGPVVAEHIDLELRPGRRLAVVGPSGIGKTTLLLTLAGLLPPRGGELLLDGVPPWEAAREQVAMRVTMTAEDAHVFSTTVLENLRVARGTLSDQEAVTLLKRAGLGSWLAALPQGLDTHIGTDATTVSGGERRRLLLARALASSAPLLLLDEPGEHIDLATADRLVGDLLTGGSSDQTQEPGRGTLLVTHRLSALGAATEVLVMGSRESGPARILGRGTHAWLAEHDATYRWSLEQEDYHD